MWKKLTEEQITRAHLFLRRTSLLFLSYSHHFIYKLGIFILIEMIQPIIVWKGKDSSSRSWGAQQRQTFRQVNDEINLNDKFTKMVRVKSLLLHSQQLSILIRDSWALQKGFHNSVFCYHSINHTETVVLDIFMWL